MKTHILIGAFFLITNTAYSAEPRIKTNLNKSTLKSNESFSLTYSLINSKSRKLNNPSGFVSLYSYSDSACSSGQAQIGSDLDLSLSNSSTYSFSSSGTFYIKPFIQGYSGSCLGPISVLSTQSNFEQFAFTQLSQNNSRFELKLDMESSTGEVSPNSTGKVSLSLKSSSDCSGPRIPGTRSSTLKPKNGSMIFRVTRPNVQDVYVCANSGSIQSSFKLDLNTSCSVSLFAHAAAVDESSGSCKISACEGGYLLLPNNSCIQMTNSKAKFVDSVSETEVNPQVKSYTISVKKKPSQQRCIYAVDEGGYSTEFLNESGESLGLSPGLFGCFDQNSSSLSLTRTVNSGNLNGLIYFYELVDGKAKVHSQHYNVQNNYPFVSDGLGISSSSTLSSSGGGVLNVWADLGFQNTIPGSIFFNQMVKLSSLGLTYGHIENDSHIFNYNYSSEKIKCLQTSPDTGESFGNCSISGTVSVPSYMVSEISGELYSQGELFFAVQPSESCVGNNSMTFSVFTSGIIIDQEGTEINIDESSSPGEVLISGVVNYPNTFNDIDGDYVFYSDELLYGSNPDSRDSDFDSIEDGQEIFVYSTNPAMEDSDGDNLSDYLEIFTYATNPLLSDTDSDGLSDNDEIFGYNWNGYVTDPNDSDTDNDGVDDGSEIGAMTDPTVNEANNNQSNPPNIVSFVSSSEEIYGWGVINTYTLTLSSPINTLSPMGPDGGFRHIVTVASGYLSYAEIISTTSTDGGYTYSIVVQGMAEPGETGSASITIHADMLCNTNGCSTQGDSTLSFSFSGMPN